MQWIAGCGAGHSPLCFRLGGSGQDGCVGGSVRVHRLMLGRVAAWFVAAVVVLGAWGATGALADTTVIGEQNLVSNIPSVEQLNKNIPVFQGDAGGGYVLSSPRRGTITSWSFLSGGIATGKHFELAVLAPVDQAGASWSLVATSAPVSVTTQTGSDALNGPFAAQIPIDVGQRIALMPVDDSLTPIETGMPSVDGIRYFNLPFNGVGSTQAVASTADDGQVVPIQATVTFIGPPAPPANTQPPSISGTAQRFVTLTGDPGLWQNGVTKFTFSWLRCATDGTNCATVPGSNSTTYPLTANDVGFTMRFQVIASNDGGDSQPAQSAPTAVVGRGAPTAQLTLTPNPSCTGIPITFDASGSVSPDGIKSYSFRIIDLYAYAHFWASQDPSYHMDFATEDDAQLYVKFAESKWKDPATDPAAKQAISDLFTERTLLSNKPNLIYTFGWDRAAVFNPSDLLYSPTINLARDPVGVAVLVTDYAGHTAQAFGTVDFAQRYSSDSRANCPKATPFRFTPPSAVLTGGLSFPRGSSQPSTTVRCVSRVACVGTITVAARACNSCATDAARRKSLVLATAFFNIPARHKRKVVLTITKLGKRRLHRGARVPARVAVVSVGPTGRTVKHAYSQILTR